MSTRSEIIDILCDTNIFPSGYKGFSWDYAEKIIPLLSQSAINNVEDINHSIRQALETLPGYKGPNGTTYSNKRSVKTREIRNPKAPKGYNLEIELI